MTVLKNTDARARIQIRLDRLAAGNPGDHKPAREGVIERRIDFGPGYRVYYCKRGEIIIIVLGAGTKKTQDQDIEAAILLARTFQEKTMDKKTLEGIRSRTTPYDSADYLKTKRDMAAYLDAALEDGDPQAITTALGNIARAKGMGQIAKDTGLNRESLYSALSPEGNPTLTTVLKVVHSLGLHLAAKPTRAPRAKANA